MSFSWEGYFANDVLLAGWNRHDFQQHEYKACDASLITQKWADSGRVWGADILKEKFEDPLFGFSVNDDSAIKDLICGNSGVGFLMPDDRRGGCVVAFLQGNRATIGQLRHLLKGLYNWPDSSKIIYGNSQVDEFKDATPLARMSKSMLQSVLRFDERETFWITEGDLGTLFYDPVSRVVDLKVGTVRSVIHLKEGYGMTVGQFWHLLAGLGCTLRGSAESQ